MVLSSNFSSESRALLFWTIIKLYSTSFNPLFASNYLNNHLFSLPGFREQSWGLRSAYAIPAVRSGLNTQIKISRLLKKNLNNNNNNNLNQNLLKEKGSKKYISLLPLKRIIYIRFL